VPGEPAGREPGEPSAAAATSGRFSESGTVPHESATRQIATGDVTLRGARAVLHGDVALTSMMVPRGDRPRRARKRRDGRARSGRTAALPQPPRVTDDANLADAAATDDGAAVGPSREILVGDGVAWLARGALPSTHAIVTSLPDLSEMRAMDFDAWRAWFVDVVALACAQVADDAPAVFYQTDVKRDGRWVDKGTLVALGAERAGAACLFHKIACRAPAGTATFGRPGYAHLVAFSRGLRPPVSASSADVLPGLGEMSWPRAMGTAACEEACRFLLRATACRVVVDPFCGFGTVLAVANAYGLDAAGVERSEKRARRARRLRFVRGAGLA